MFTSTFYTYGKSDSSKAITQFVLDQDRVVRLTDNIWCSITIDREKADESAKYFVNVTLLSLYSIDVVHAFIKQCLDKYKKDIERRLHEQKYIFMLNSSNKGELVYTEVEFSSNKNFDNMFFTGKEDFVDRVNYFMQNKDKYDSVGMPYTLGILLSGPPGTGKSSCIKGLANHMDRHIIIITPSLVTNKNVLVDIFCEPKINNKTIPMDKRIYVIEELDCGAWGSIVSDRALITNKEDGDNKNNQMIELLARKIVNTEDTVNVAPCQSTLTLADVLEVLDGLMETPGRVIVFTSNHPEKLDKALLRPGRINMMFEFQRLEKNDVNKMYQLWFGEYLPNDVLNNMRDMMFTQAEIGELFITKGNNKKLLWEALSKPHSS